jgi:hypothetical protein
LEAIRYFGRKNINTCVSDVSRKLNLDTKLLDFKILKISTHIIDAKNNKTIEEVDNTKATEILDLYLMNPSYRLEQIYDIEVFKKELNPKAICQLSYIANNTNTRITLVIKAGSNFQYYAELGEYLYNEINKKIIQFGYLVKIFEHDLKAKIDRFINYFNDQSFTLEEDIKIVVAENRVFQESITQQLILNIKEKTTVQNWNSYIENQETKKLIIEVEPDETLMTLTKPRYGNPSIDLFGNFLTVREPTFFTKEISLGKNVYVLEDEKNSYYKSEILGAVNYKEGAYFVHLDVSEELSIKKVGFKETGDINLVNTRLKIEERNIAFDSVTDNIKINTETVHIRGFVGKFVSIFCKELIIEGGTHNTDTLECDRANIKNCNCQLKCEEAEINMADGTKIYCGVATIEIMNKSELIGKNFEIGSLLNYNSITFSNTLTINEVRGFNNKIIASSITTKDAEAKYEQFKAELENLKNEHATLHKQFSEILKRAEISKAPIASIKAKIIEIKQKGFAIPIAYTRQLKAYNELIKKAGDMRAQLQEISDMERIKEDEISLITKQSLNSRIICDFVWPEYNEIIYIIDDKEIKFKPEPKNYGSIYLEFTGDNYRIRGTNAITT